MTLDADVVLLRSFNLDEILADTADIQISKESSIGNNDNNNKIIDVRKKAIYEYENRYLAHPHWWVGSEKLLNITSRSPEKQGFGVTPALLSTYGSLLTLAAVEEAMLLGLEKDYPGTCISCSGDIVSNEESRKKESHLFHDEVAHECSVSGDSCRNLQVEVESRWLDGFGRDGVLWSEYTLYRIVLDHYQVCYLHRSIYYVNLLYS